MGVWGIGYVCPPPTQIEVVNDKIGMAYSGMGPDFRYSIPHTSLGVWE